MKYLTSIILLSLLSCAASRQATTHKQKLSVSFFSRGNGIDLKNRGEYDTYLTNFQKDNHLTISYEQKKWGREGEVDYCIDIPSLPKNKVDKFISETRQLLSQSQLVIITEVDVCRH